MKEESFRITGMCLSFVCSFSDKLWINTLTVEEQVVATSSTATSMSRSIMVNQMEKKSVSLLGVLSRTRITTKIKIPSAR